MTAAALKLLASGVLSLGSLPTLLTLFDATPMGYHDGLALAWRLGLTLLATLLLASVVAYAGALYWVNVVRPAPARRS